MVVDTAGTPARFRMCLNRVQGVLRVHVENMNETVLRGDLRVGWEGSGTAMSRKEVERRRKKEARQNESRRERERESRDKESYKI